MVLAVPFEESDISAADPLVAMINKCQAYLKLEFCGKLLVTAGEKDAVRQNAKALKEAYATGTRLLTWSPKRLP